MRLHEDSRLFRQAVLATAQAMQLPEIFVEKDYWVTLALKAVFGSTAAADCVFKGGTSLSKCYGLIDRFKRGGDGDRTRGVLRVGDFICRALPSAVVGNSFFAFSEFFRGKKFGCGFSAPGFSWPLLFEMAAEMKAEAEENYQNRRPTSRL